MRNTAKKYMQAIGRVERELIRKSDTEEFAVLVRRMADTLAGIEWVLDADEGSVRSEKIVEDLKDARARLMTVKTAVQAERVRLLGILPNGSVLADSRMWN